MQQWRISITKFYSFLLGITAFFSLYPYFLWSEMNTVLSNGLGGLNFGRIFELVCIVFVFLTFNKLSIKKLDFQIACTLLIFILYMIMGILSEISITSVIARIIQCLVMIIIIVSPKEIIIDAYKCFVAIFAISLIPGILVFLLHLVNVNVPYKAIEAINMTSSSGSFYRVYPGAVFINTLHNAGINEWRLCGMLDEPGAVGTLSALLLLTRGRKGLKIWDRICFIVLCVAGVLSFSLAFYVIIAVGIVIKSTQERRFKPAIIMIGIFLAYFVFLEINFGNERIAALQERMRLIDGVLIGSNRVHSSFERQFESFLSGDKLRLLFGYGDGAAYANSDMSSSSTYKSLIYSYGVVGFIYEIMWFIFAGLKKSISSNGKINRAALALLFAFVISIYQRPNVINMGYFLILFGGIAYIFFVESKAINCDIKQEVRK